MNSDDSLDAEDAKLLRQLKWTSVMEKPDEYIYVVAMFSLDENSNDRRTARSEKIRAKRGHEKICEDKTCPICYYTRQPSTVGWFRTFELADREVLNYAPWDHLYTHAVVEAVPQGFHCMWRDADGNDIGSQVLQWYRIIREPGKNDVDCKAERCDPPNGYADSFGVTMG